MPIRELDYDIRWSSVTSSLMLASAPQLISVRISAKSLLEDDAFSLVAETISCSAVRPIYASTHTQTYRQTDRHIDKPMGVSFVEHQIFILLKLHRFDNLQ